MRLISSFLFITRPLANRSTSVFTNRGLVFRMTTTTNGTKPQKPQKAKNNGNKKEVKILMLHGKSRQSAQSELRLYMSLKS
jgi:hypothetical protein